MARKTRPVNVDDVFINIAQPQREWRVTQHDGETVTLERVDRPGALRFVEVAELRDSNRYLLKRHGVA